MLTLRSLSYLVAAADHESVTEAAASLNISQPAISAAIARLEGHYDQQIFVRQKGRGVGLTPFGREVVARMRSLLNQAAELEHYGRGRDTPVGEVSLGCFAELAPHYLPALTKAFEKSFPLVRVRFREAGFDELPRFLNDGSIDLMLDYDIGLPEDIEQVTLTSLAPYVLLPGSHRWAGRKDLNLENLAKEPLILASDSQSRRYLLDLFHRRGLRPEVSRTAESFETLRGLVANGYGISVVHSRPASQVSYDGSPLVSIPLADVEPTHRILLAWSRRFPLSPAAEAYRDFTVNWFRQRT
ncbi:LysR family transcriptional regulator [Denitrobaculum tricleocarpae]|uniref:LysR family transcriptional regulator n=1 Tax=Denitrobaculum tricleocarpae TaxID=2591009 RepID=A0A545TWM7_9PROT|nr:LysR family transcriptional regulator [Denitrobaculum tricleocarpae]TQV81625.1 LysR family transcriptional regulator [Denitrobaculum tricleocarpae]